MPKIVQINTALNCGSHGRIVEQISHVGAGRGFDTTIVHGARYVNKSQFADIQTTTKNQERLNGMRSLLFDAHGLGLKCATKSLITKLEEIKPDIVHLHNIHGYYLNYQILFDYLAKSGVPVVWTLHDCWSITGHCSQFENYNCDKWKTQCHDCQYIMDWYPKSLIDRSRRNFELKKQCFTSVKNMTIVPVSHWLEDKVKQSFLAKYPIKVINNGVDISSFRPSEASGKISSNKFMILGVASNWDDDKGVQEFIKLSDNVYYQVVMVGVKDELKQKLPKSIIAVSRTNNQQELAEYYSLADVFVNPTYKDTFPTVNLEALACGTPVITYKTGGSPESITPETGIVVDKGDFEQLCTAIEVVRKNGKHCYSDSCRERAVKFYNKDDRFKDYIDLYENILDNSDI
ncbi:MAG: glycosyltransferase [Bacteroidales bacterium]|nr:glycosyltransferase [Bacteroidales bacterium]